MTSSHTKILATLPSFIADSKCYRPYSISCVSSQNLIFYAQSLEVELLKEFSTTKFVDSTMTSDRVVQECLYQPSVQIMDQVVHLIAFEGKNCSGNIIGALFDIYPDSLGSRKGLRLLPGWIPIRT